MYKNIDIKKFHLGKKKLLSIHLKAGTVLHGGDKAPRALPSRFKRALQFINLQMLGKTEEGH